jgi:dolichyl-phosphate beta-glucosyltransferase
VARDLFSHVQVKRFGFDVELLFLARRWGMRLVRIPVIMRDVAGSSVRLGQDSAQMLYDILLIRIRYERGDYPLTRPAGDRAT